MIKDWAELKSWIFFQKQTYEYIVTIPMLCWDACEKTKCHSQIKQQWYLKRKKNCK